jgi:uncharacterized RDD family membrane protein YckC
LRYGYIEYIHGTVFFYKQSIDCDYNIFDEELNLMTIAPFKKRIFALIVDGIIFLILFCVGYFIILGKHQPFTGQDGTGYSYGIIVPAYFYLMAIGSWMLFITIAEFRTGQSLGKRVLGIRVVRQDFAKTAISDTLTRHLFDLVDLILFAGLWVALTNKKSQRIGDLVARTIVVIE